MPNDPNDPFLNLLGYGEDAYGDDYYGSPLPREYPRWPGLSPDVLAIDPNDYIELGIPIG